MDPNGFGDTGWRQQSLLMLWGKREAALEQRYWRRDSPLTEILPEKRRRIHTTDVFRAVAAHEQLKYGKEQGEIL